MSEPTTCSGPAEGVELSTQVWERIPAWLVEGAIALIMSVDTLATIITCATSANVARAMMATSPYRNALVWTRDVAADPAAPAMGAPTPVAVRAAVVAAPAPEAATSWAPPTMSPLRAFWAPRSPLTATSDPVAFLMPASAPFWARALPVLGPSAPGAASLPDPRSPVPGPYSPSLSGMDVSPVSPPGWVCSSAIGSLLLAAPQWAGPRGAVGQRPPRTIGGAWKPK